MTNTPEVLILDNDRQRVQQLRAWLKQWNYASTLATNANEAQKVLTAEDGPAIAIVVFPSFRDDASRLMESIQSVRQRRPFHCIAGIDQPATLAGRELPELAPGFRPDDVFLLPANQRVLRSKLRSAERVVEVEAQLAESTRAATFFSSHDALTTLPQRETAMAVLAREADRAQRGGVPVSVLLFDLDLFQQLNAAAGYDAGTRVLRELGLRLRRTMRGYDIAARFGSDEFLLILPECRIEDAARRAQRMQQQVLGAEFRGPNGALRLTASFGIAETTNQHPHQTLAAAEDALREAKRQGAGSIVCAHVPQALRQISQTPLQGAPRAALAIAR